MTEDLTDYLEDSKEYVILAEELMIDPDKPLYLMTWAPDPKQLPNCHFEYQHRYNISTLSLYLRSCYSGCFCVESTQLGNPHYHGWYQVSNGPDSARIATMKTLQKLGLVKVTQAKHYKIDCYTERQNALYYYKKELTTAMNFIIDNPITAYSTCGINWDMTHFFDSTVNAKHISNVVSEKQRLLEFYRDSTI